MVVVLRLAAIEGKHRPRRRTNRLSEIAGQSLFGRYCTLRKKSDDQRQDQRRRHPTDDGMPPVSQTRQPTLLHAPICGEFPREVHVTEGRTSAARTSVHFAGGQGNLRIEESDWPGCGPMLVQPEPC